MDFIEGAQRDQIALFPDALQDYIGGDNPVRFLDAYVAQLDLERLGFRHASVADVGRPPYDPGDLLRLYLYGYLNRIRSSRRLERECGRNVELLWLLRRLRPDFKTIADFRKDNREPLVGVCREFTDLCKRLDLFAGELVAIDGSKFKAVNSRARNFSHRKVKRKVDQIDQKIEAYLKDLDEEDQGEREAAGPSGEELRQKIQELRERREELQGIEKQLQDGQESQISLTDGDSRSMALGASRGTQVGYNVQLAVDSKHKLIVDHEVTNAVTDRDQLSAMASRAKEVLQVQELQAVADMGYYFGKEIKACVEAGITPYVPQPDTSANKKLGLFAKKDFRYDPDRDCYLCPAGQSLNYRFQTTEMDRDIRYYATSACRSCELKARCTRNKEGRRITRWVDEAVLEAMERRVRGEPEKTRKRKELVEHPFGTLKHSMNQGYFLMRGLAKVRAEMSLSVMAYNIKRAINILGVRQIIAALS
jgi:transposase